jgi:hypothetical protein
MLGRRSSLKRRVVTAEEFEEMVAGHVNEFVDEEGARVLAGEEATIAAGTMVTDDGMVRHEAWRRAEPHATELAIEEPARPRGGKSSHLKMLEAMPPTAKRIYRLGLELRSLNPRDKGTFDLGVRDKRLRCSPSTASTHIRLHVKAGTWSLVARASFRGRMAATYRIVDPGDVDYETAMAVYSGYREQAKNRLAAGLNGRRPGWRAEARHAAQTPNTRGRHAAQDAAQTPNTSRDAAHTK